MDNEEAQEEEEEEEEVVDEIEIEIDIDPSATTTARPAAVTITLTTTTRSRSKRPRPRSRPRQTTGSAGGWKGRMKPATPAGESMDRHALDEDEERLVRRHREAAAFIEIEEEDEEIAGVVNSSGFGPEMMEVDDREDPVDVLVDLDKHLLPVDSDFFNSFADDFDDSDLS